MKIVGPGRYLDEAELAGAGFKSIGRNVLVHETAILADVENIEIGSNVRIDAYAVLSANGGSIRLGNYIHISAGVHIHGQCGVDIGAFSSVSAGSRIYSECDDVSGEMLVNPTVPGEYRKTSKGPVKLGRYATIGANSVVMPALSVGEGSAVGAMSFVRKNLEPWGIYAGSPLRFLRPRRKDLTLLADHVDGNVVKIDIPRAHREAAHQHDEMGGPSRRAPRL